MISIKKLRARWLDKEVLALLEKIKNVLYSGDVLEQKHTPFGLLSNGLADFRGIDFTSIKIIKNADIKNCDLSYSSFLNVRFENNHIENVFFLKVNFSEMSDRGNTFRKVLFDGCKFNKSAIGYKGSIYDNCTFKKSNFTKAVFIRTEYVNTGFIDCNFKGVDFNASSFEDCKFKGKIENVWFRGGYMIPLGDIKEFGKAKKNEMKNVSFEESDLINIHFSNDCNLSTIKLPNSGNYLIYNNWYGRLLTLKEKSKEFKEEDEKEILIFSKSNLVHAKNQDWYLINIDELKKEFGFELTDKIISILSEGDNG